MLLMSCQSSQRAQRDAVVTRCEWIHKIYLFITKYILVVKGRGKSADARAERGQRIQRPMVLHDDATMSLPVVAPPGSGIHQRMDGE